MHQPWLCCAGLLLLVVALVYWCKRRRPGQIGLEQMVVVTAILSLIATPYIWSFDFILLLVPTLQLAVWAIEDRLPRIHAAVITLLFVVANFLILRQRSLQAPESEFFWLPLVLALLYFWAWRLASSSR